MPWFSWRRRSAGRILDMEAAPDALIAGRVRAVGVPYMLPRDMEEANRLDFQHYLLRYTFQGIYLVHLGGAAVPGGLISCWQACHRAHV